MDIDFIDDIEPVIKKAGRPVKSVEHVKFVEHVKIDPARIKLLRNVISLSYKKDKVSFGGELKAVPRENLSLFYRSSTQNIIGCIDLPGTPPELNNLITACHAATFGLQGEDVLDATYRKALKLDIENFGINFSPGALGLIGTLHDALLGFGNEGSLRAELYKLNVYAEGGFFKTHVDTPRGEGMIGSLVVGLPVAHSGGALVVGEGEKKKRHDFSNDGSDTTVRWAAFYSDVQHEVEPVTSGHRVTLTYNLFVKKATPSPPPLSLSGEVKAESFYQVLQAELQSKEFSPNGSILGFGLKHKYPFATANPNVANTNNLSHYLKATDRLIHAVGTALGLETKLQICCRVGEASITFLTDDLGPFPCDGFEDSAWVFSEDSNYEVIQRNDLGRNKVEWVTPQTAKNVKKWDWLHYGNEASLVHSYGNFCLTMRIPEWSEERGRV